MCHFDISTVLSDSGSKGKVKRFFWGGYLLGFLEGFFGILGDWGGGEWIFRIFFQIF